MLLDGASAVLSIQVAAELPAALLVGRRVVVLGDDPATWLVAGVFGSTMLNVASGLAQLDASSNLDVAGVYEVAGTQVVGARGAAVAAAVNAAAAPTKAEFDALVAVVNALRARLTAHGLTA